MTIERQNVSSTNPNTACAEFMSVRRAADILRVSTSKLYRMKRNSDSPFRVTKRGRRVLVDRVDFERHLAEQSTLTNAADSHGTAIASRESVDENRAASIPEVAPASANCGQRDFISPFRFNDGFSVTFVYELIG